MNCTDDDFIVCGTIVCSDLFYDGSSGKEKNKKCRNSMIRSRLEMRFLQWEGLSQQ